MFLCDYSQCIAHYKKASDLMVTKPSLQIDTMDGMLFFNSIDRIPPLRPLLLLLLHSPPWLHPLMHACLYSLFVAFVCNKASTTTMGVHVK